MIILLSGKPCSGKSQLLNLLEQDGYRCYNIDAYVNDIYQKNAIGYILIKQNFGNEYVNDQGVDKDKLRELVLNDKAQLNKLQSLIWPLIKKQLLWLKIASPFIVVEMGIYLIDRHYFDQIFDKVIIVETPATMTDIPQSKKKMYELYNNVEYKSTDYIIQNNTDLLHAYQELKVIINKLNERKADEEHFTYPLNDGYVVSQNQPLRAVLIWPSLYNCNFSQSVMHLQTTFKSLINHLFPIINLSIGVDLLSYTSLKETINENIHLFVIQLSPFAINDGLIVMLENRTNHNSRILSNHVSSLIHKTLFENLFKTYHMKFNLSNNSFLIIAGTFFILHSMYEQIVNIQQWNETDFLNYLKLFFNVDEMIVLDDSNRTSYHTIFDYINYIDQTLFIPDADHNTFKQNYLKLKQWSQQNGYKLILLEILKADNTWFSSTNFIKIQKNIIIFNLDENSKKLFHKEIKLVNKSLNIIWIDNALYGAKCFYGINSIIKLINSTKF